MDIEIKLDKLEKRIMAMQNDLKEMIEIINTIRGNPRIKSYAGDEVFIKAILQAIRLIFETDDKLETSPGKVSYCTSLSLMAGDILDKMIDNKLWVQQNRFKECSDIGKVLNSLGFTEIKRTSRGIFHIIKRDSLKELILKGEHKL